MKCAAVAGSLVLLSLAASQAQAPTPGSEPAKAVATAFGATYSLDQFGPVKSPVDAEKTYRKASADIIAAGGGILMIPQDAAAQWKPANDTQEQWRKPAPPATAK